MLSKEGRLRVFLTSGNPILDLHGNCIGYRGMDRDITESKLVQETLRKSESRFQNMANTVPVMLYDYVFFPNWGGQFVYVGPRCRDILELNEEELVADGLRFWNMVHPEDLLLLRESNLMSIQETKNFAGEVRIVTPSGAEKWIQIIARPGTTEVEGSAIWSGFILDVTERKAIEAELNHSHRLLEDQVRRDLLTGLFNRRAWNERVDEEWRRATRHAKALSMLIIDIDKFKIFNDQYGHLSGDQCLRQVAEAIGQCATRVSDVVARFGGEEFVVLLGGTSGKNAGIVAERIRQSVLHLRIQNEGSPADHLLSVSIGVATAKPEAVGGVYTHPSGQALSPDALLDMADKALYDAKLAGRNRVCFFPAQG